MNIHEFQAKDLFRKSGVTVLRNQVVYSADEAKEAYQALTSQSDSSVVAVKSQIHAGGRGKGHIIGNESQKGVVIVSSADEAASAVQNLLGHKLRTLQTGPEGQTVRQVLIEEGCKIARELYLGIVVDRGTKLPVVIASTEGGVEIEEVAKETPEKIFHEPFDPDFGLRPFQIGKLAQKLQLGQNTARAARKFLTALTKFFVEKDCSLVEINPLVVTESDELVALDAKVSFDENALFRHPDIQELRDRAEEEPSETQAGDAGLSYVKLDGNIACLVNGAGLAMSTMDLIKLHGGEPANFLDVGGGAKTEQVTEAFRIILDDKNVKAVLVNIFGGIMQCTTIANALITAYKTVGFNVPLVVRLEGTEVEEGKRILAESDVDIITAEGLTDAAQKVVQAAG